ncbi:hypothetical protein FOVSG1_001646 [Fusarium oxysporum f. sp. vasinfectum]
MGGLIRESQNLQRLFPPFTTRPPYSRGCSNPPSTCIKSWTRIFSVGEVHTLRYIEEGTKRLGVSPCRGSYTGAYNDALFYLLYDVAFASPSFHPLNNSRYMVNHTAQDIDLSNFDVINLGNGSSVE